MLDAMTGDRRASCHIHRSDSSGPTGVVEFADGRGYAIPGVNTYSDSGGASRFFFRADYDESEGETCT